MHILFICGFFFLRFFKNDFQTVSRNTLKRKPQSVFLNCLVWEFARRVKNKCYFVVENSTLRVWFFFFKLFFNVIIHIYIYIYVLWNECKLCAEHNNITLIVGRTRAKSLRAATTVQYKYMVITEFVDDIQETVCKKKNKSINRLKEEEKTFFFSSYCIIIAHGTHGGKRENE